MKSMARFHPIHNGKKKFHPVHNVMKISTQCIMSSNFHPVHIVIKFSTRYILSRKFPPSAYCHENFHPVDIAAKISTQCILSWKFPPSAYCHGNFHPMHIVMKVSTQCIWSGSTWAQIMACYLTSPNHYLNQCRLLVSKVLWHSPESNFISQWVPKLLVLSNMFAKWNI